MSAVLINLNRENKMKNRRFQKKTGLFILMMLLLVSVAAQADAGSADAYQWDDKLGRGFLNAVTGLVEIPREINFTSNDINLTAGWTYGLARGVGFALLRTGTGLLDVLTAPWNWPDAQKAPLMTPEYPWEKDRSKLL